MPDISLRFGHFIKILPNVFARSVFCDDTLGAPEEVSNLSPESEIAHPCGCTLGVTAGKSTGCSE
jgi:hypothetical protein